MTADNLQRLGSALYGNRWKAPLARSLGVQRETVSRWVSTGNMPQWVATWANLMIKDKGTVLSLCDRTGNMVKPWAEAGFDCICVDIQHEGISRQDNITFIGDDIRSYMPPPRKYAIVFAFPPCTNLAVSGAAWFKQKGINGLMDGIELVEACRKICQWSEAPWMLENPVSTLASYWRKADHMFDPCDYGGYLSPPADRYTKKTCLWTGSGFTMPQKKWVEPTEGSKMHRLPPSKDRGDLRSVTPMGFAHAVFQTHAHEIIRRFPEREYGRI